MTNPTKRPFVRWMILAAVGLALVVGIVLAVRYSRPAVVVTPLIEAEAVQAFYATGTLEPADREYPRRAAVPGFVRPPEGQRLIDKGEFVRQGQVIAVVYNDEYALARAKALADVTEKRLRADPASSPVLKGFDEQIAAIEQRLSVDRGEFERLQTAMRSGAAGQTDLNNALRTLKTDEGLLASLQSERGQAKLRLDRELAEAEAALQVADWNISQTYVVSPIDGYAMDKPAQPGTRVAANDLIVTIANTSPQNLVMRAQVDEEDITKVWLTPATQPTDHPTTEPAAAQSATTQSATAQPTTTQPAAPPREPQVVRMTLYSFSDESTVFSGRVVKIYPKADPERRTFEVDVAIDKPSPLMKAGMTGELAFETARKAKAVVAPSQALQDGKFWVIRNGKLRPADARPGLRSVERVEVVGNLQPGDQVVISPVAGLDDGQSVRIGQQMDPIAAAELNKPKKKELFRGGF
jgi:RND family efflux transporter MFP subunit